jgi:predicted nucleic acid-binding protein
VTLCVLDASVALTWSFQDETSPYAEYVIGSLTHVDAVVPPIWPIEITNALLSAVRRGRIPEEDANRFLLDLGRLLVNVDREIALDALGQRILRLGLAHGLSAYDTSYLELALRRGLPLATLDERLERAAATAGIPILRP